MPEGGIPIVLCLVRRHSPAPTTPKSEVCGSSGCFSQVPLRTTDDVCNCRLLTQTRQGSLPELAPSSVVNSCFVHALIPVFSYAMGTTAIVRLSAEAF